MHLCYVLTFFATCSFDIFVSMVCVSEHGHDRWCTNVHSPVHSSTCRSVLFGIAACWEHVALRLCWRAQRAAAPSPWAPRPMPWWCGDCATRPPPPPFRVKKEEKRGRKRRTEVNMFCKKRKHIKWRQHSRGMSDAGLSGWNMKGVRSVNLWSVTWWMQVEARSVTKIWNRKRRGYVQNNVAEKMTSCGHGTKVTVDSNLLISPIYSAPIWGRRRFTVQNAIMWKGQLTNDSKAAGSFGSADWPPGLVCKPLKSWINNIYDLSTDAVSGTPQQMLHSTVSTAQLLVECHYEGQADCEPEPKKPLLTGSPHGWQCSNCSKCSNWFVRSKFDLDPHWPSLILIMCHCLSRLQILLQFPL